MADNLTTQSSTPATVPSSTVIATDDVAGVHYQRVKLVDGTLDGTGAIGGDATNGLDVDVTRVQGTVTVGDGGSTLSVDDGGGSLTVDGTVAVTGTFWQATQPVSGTVTIQDGGGTVSIDDGAGSLTVDGTVAVSSLAGTVTVDGSGVTQPVSAASLPLPTGASTAAKQPALGTAGTPSTDVISIQGVASGTAVPVSDGGGNISIDDGGNSITVDNGGTFAVQSTPSVSTGFIKGSASATGTADTSVIAAAGVGVKNYVTSIHVANTGTSTSLITLKDGSGGSTLLTTIAPALGGSNITLPIPIATSASTALFFACGTASTTIYITAVGYTGA